MLKRWREVGSESTDGRGESAGLMPGHPGFSIDVPQNQSDFFEDESELLELESDFVDDSLDAALSASADFLYESLR